MDTLHIQQGSELTLTLCLTKGKYVKLKTMAYQSSTKIPQAVIFSIQVM